MKLLFENWKKYLTEEKWKETSWTSEDGSETITISQIIAYLGSQTVDVDPIKVKDQVLKARSKDRLPVGPGITSQERVDAADLSFPIIVGMKGGEYIVVLDGNHRLQKAVDHNMPLKAKILVLDDPQTPQSYKELFG
tara:strand:+ start:610 stop:1020 length:411 start_codon:yes stop_codon:yes gene_type:complete